MTTTTPATRPVQDALVRAPEAPATRGPDRPVLADGDQITLADLFATRGVRVAHPHGRTLVEEGEPAGALYLITSGIVRESTMLPDGRRHIVDFLGRGEVFGLAEEPDEQHLVEAETDVSLLRLPWATVRRAAKEDCGLARAMMRLVERRLAKSQEKMVAMGCLCSVERTAHFLGWLADMNESWGIGRPEILPPRLGSLCCAPPPDASFLIPMTRREIADYLGLTLETVCRAFTRLRDLGLIETPTATTFRIVDRDALDAFVLAERR